MKRDIDNSVLAVLSSGRCDGPRYFLPQSKLDRKQYEAVNKVLDALGGKWNRSAKAHVFAEDCTDLIDSAIETGTYVRPADMGWLPTPAPLAAKVAAMAQIGPGMFVLEPSAGLGALAIEATRLGALVDCHEIDSSRAAALQAIEGVQNVKVGDFLSSAPEPIFDRVLMNPPFAKRADIHHVLHARKFLKPEGLLVSIMSAGVVFREDALTKEFRGQCDFIEPLPDDSFKASGTSVNTAVIAMRAAP